jgi:Na+/phosphate symporter
MFSDGADQSINQRLTRRLGNCVDAPLLGCLVGMVQVELVGELV